MHESSKASSWSALGSWRNSAACGSVATRVAARRTAPTVLLWRSLHWKLEEAGASEEGWKGAAASRDTGGHGCSGYGEQRPRPRTQLAWPLSESPSRSVTCRSSAPSMNARKYLCRLRSLPHRTDPDSPACGGDDEHGGLASWSAGLSASTRVRQARHNGRTFLRTWRVSSIAACAGRDKFASCTASVGHSEDITWCAALVVA